jgi:hypothetical protein
VTEPSNKVIEGKSILEAGKEVYSKDLNEHFNKIIAEHGINAKDSIPLEDMQFEDETDKVKVKIKIDNFSGRKDFNYEDIESTEIQFYILVKVK